MSMTISLLERRILDRLVEQFAVPDDTGPDTGWEDLGFDSLALVELGLVLEKEYSVQVDDVELKEAGNVAGVAALLISKGVSGA
ncbi:acyl carrier protein [Streptomyces sp. NPDC052052]|uniref:acyl carrier protein n=1 Tax=Streptomyces sp. NPDC052052 TaxID=3154756 RepID=UPI0034388AB9